MDEVTQAVENLKKEWSQAVAQLEVCIAAIESCGKTGKGTEEAMSLPRLNGSAQDALQLLNALHCRLDLLAEQLPTFEEVQSGQATLGSWNEQYQRLRVSLRTANLQAKANIGKAAQEERELLLGGGEESTIRRRNLQTKAGMTSAAESIIESLRRSRQLMVQVSTPACILISHMLMISCVLRKAEGEYQGYRSLLMRTRGLLSTMQRQDVLDRIILTFGFLIFSLVVLYVVSRRIGLLTLQRKLADAIRSGSVPAEDMLEQDERQHKEECEAIRKLISSQPPRSEIEKLIANLEKEIANLEAENEACTRMLELRKKQFALILHVNHGAAAPAIYTVHFHLELRARPGKSTAKYCNNTTSGNGCHLGVEQ
ncbi:THO complex subunit 7A [Hordeum vulgare]|nr:THO complex subunit 7A [Hordeum vulgare]